MTRRRKEQLRRWAIYALTLAVLGLIAVNADWARLQETFFDPEKFADLFPRIITVAAKNTIILALLAFAGGLTLGLVLALMRLSTIGPYRWAALTYIELFRGIPAILTLMLVGFVLPIALGVRMQELLPFLGDKAAPVVGLSVVASAYLAETIRGGIEAVPKGQMEAARSLGMSRSQAMRSIIIPQAFRVMIPPMTNEFVLLIKDTSLIFVLGVAVAEQDLAFFTKADVQRTLNGTAFVAAALLYLAITLPLTALSRHLERSGAGSSSRRKLRGRTPAPAAANDEVWDG
ncbi:MAG: amino acid ABC transporter permease [Microthrixaceae bacterium]